MTFFGMMGGMLITMVMIMPKTTGEWLAEIHKAYRAAMKENDDADA